MVRLDAAILALVVVKGGVSREHIARWLWPDAPLTDAQNRLRQRIFHLRRMSGAHLLAGDGVQLQLGAGVTHDLADLAIRLQADSSALSGDLLDGLHYDQLEEFDLWLSDARQQWRLDRQHLLAQVAEALEADNRIALALPYAERLVSEDALAEHAHRRVMRLHFLRGDRAAALAAYERCRAVLADELDAAPSRETCELLRAVERDEPDPKIVARPTLVAICHRPRLVGRHAEWLAIDRAWSRGHTVLLYGEPGIGKTHLARDFGKAWQGVQECLAIHGDSLLPYATLARLLPQLIDLYGPPHEGWLCSELAPLVPGLEAPAKPSGQPLRLRQALLEALTGWAHIGTTVCEPVREYQGSTGDSGNDGDSHSTGRGSWSGLVVDDLQFMDADSLEVLLAWISSGDAPPCLLTVRAREVPPEVTGWLASRERGRVLELAVGPLDAAGIANLLQTMQLPGLDALLWTEPLLQHTGGNPLFLMETLIAVVDRRVGLPLPIDVQLPAPQRVTRLIEQRLEALPATAMRLARVAALAGPDFDAELAATVLGMPVLDLATDWAVLEAAHVLRNGAFAHGLIHEATLRQVPKDIARVLHRNMARELQRLERPAVRVADHWHAAQAWPEAAAQFEAAADAAAALGRRDEECRLLERAAQCHDRANEAPAAFDARVRAADAMIAVGSLVDATRRLERLQSQCGNDAQLLAVRLSQAKAAITDYDASAGRAVAEVALELAASVGDRQGQFDATCMLGSALALDGKAAEALAALQAQLDFGESQASPASRGSFHGTLGYVLTMADRRVEAMPHLRLAAEIAEQVGNLPDALIELGNLASAVSTLGRVDDTLALAERAVRLRERMGDAEGLGAAMNQSLIGLACTVLGQYTRALAASETALAGFRAAGATAWVVVGEGLLASLYLALGQRARAAQALGVVPPGTRAAQAARRLVIEARIERAAGSSGLDKLRRAVALLDGATVSLEQLREQLALAAALEPEEALPMCRDIAAKADQRELNGIAMTAQVRETEMLARLGRGTEAAALSQMLVQRIDACNPNDMYRGEFWWIMFKAFDAAGQARDAGDALRCGVAWVGEALPQVPEPFRDSFLHRNEVNRLLLPMANQRLGETIRPRSH